MKKGVEKTKLVFEFSPVYHFSIHKVKSQSQGCTALSGWPHNMSALFF